jgi:hypothetical protein
MAFWRDLKDSRAFRIVQQPPEGAEPQSTELPG